MQGIDPHLNTHTHTHTLNRWTYVCVGCGCWSVWPKTVFTAVWIIHKRRQFRCCVSVVCRGEQLSRQRSTRLFRLSHRIPHPTAAALLMSAPSSFYSPFKLKEIRRNSLAQWTKIWINFQLWSRKCSKGRIWNFHKWKDNTGWKPMIFFPFTWNIAKTSITSRKHRSVAFLLLRGPCSTASSADR